MSGRREQLQEKDLSDPNTAARGLNDILRSLYTRLEACERSQFVDLEVASDSGGTVPPIALQAPEWPVMGVYIAKLFDVTNSLPVFLTESLMWTVSDGNVSIPAMYMPAVSTRYAVRFEVRG